MFYNECWVLWTRQGVPVIKKGDIIEGKGIVIREGRLTQEKYGWTLGKKTNNFLLDLKLPGKSSKILPLYHCVTGEGTARILPIPKINPNIKNDGVYTETVLSMEGMVSNSVLGRIIDADVSNAYVDEPDTRKDLLLGMLMGGMYSAIIVRPDLFQGPIGIIMLFGLMGGFMLLSRG